MDKERNLIVLEKQRKNKNKNEKKQNIFHALLKQAKQNDISDIIMQV